MYSSFITIAAFLLYVCNAGCGTEDTSIPQLAVTIGTSTWAGSDNDLYGRVLYGSKGEKVWSDWMELDDNSCNNHEKGQTDYYNDFEDITDEWTAIALYNCGTDGMEFETLRVWDGEKGVDIDLFCPGIAGPSLSCGGIEDDTAGSCSKVFDTETPYATYWLDQDGADCHAMSFTVAKSTAGQTIAKPYVRSDPGIAPCNGRRKQKQLVAQLQMDNAQMTSFVSNNVMFASAVVLVFIAAMAALYHYFGTTKQEKTLVSETHNLLYT